MLYLQEEIKRYNKKSIFPWVNLWRKRMKKKLIEEFFYSTHINESYQYTNIRVLAELYHYLNNICIVDLPAINTDSHSFIPCINSVISGDDYIELNLSFTDITDNNSSMKYRFMFDDNNSIFIKRTIYTDMYRKSETRDVTISKAVRLGTIEHFLIRNSFVESIRLMTQTYLNK